MKPSVGRIVHVTMAQFPDRVFAAIITRVWTDVCINVAVFVDANGFEVKHVTSVMLEQPGTAVSWKWPVLT